MVALIEISRKMTRNTFWQFRLGYADGSKTKAQGLLV